MCLFYLGGGGVGGCGGCEGVEVGLTGMFVLTGVVCADYEAGEDWDFELVWWKVSWWTRMSGGMPRS